MDIVTCESLDDFKKILKCDRLDDSTLIVSLSCVIQPDEFPDKYINTPITHATSKFLKYTYNKYC